MTYEEARTALRTGRSVSRKRWGGRRWGTIVGVDLRLFRKGRATYCYPKVCDMRAVDWVVHEPAVH